VVGELITLAQEAPELERGATYRDIAHWPRKITPKDWPAYEITEFDFRVPEVRYEPCPPPRRVPRPSAPRCCATASA
jgi:hypothetical protein